MAAHPNLPPGYPDRADGRGRARKRYKGILYDFGKYGSPDSIKEYNRWLSEMLSLQESDSGKPQRELIGVLIAKFLRHLKVERGDGHREVLAMSRACVPLDRLYGVTFADDFRLPHLRAVQRAMTVGSWMNDEDKAVLKAMKKPQNWCASYVNKQIKRLLQFFQWAEESLYVPEGRHHHLCSITSIHASDKRARHAPKRKPVDWEKQVEPILPVLTPQMAAIAQVQYLTGSRPGEILQMKAGEIDRAGPDGCWLFTPGQHKGSWRGHGRVIVIGPKAQAILAPFLLQAPGDDAYVFRPGRRATRCYTNEAYCKAVRLACADARVVAWRPYDLRHQASRRVRQDFGEQGVKVHLGHASPDTAKLYGKGLSEEDVREAARIARAIG